MQVKKGIQINNVETKMTNAERNIYSSFFSSNGIFFNLVISWSETLGNSSIFVIYNFFDLFEMKIKLLIVVIMSLMLFDKRREVLLFIYNW